MPGLPYYPARRAAAQASGRPKFGPGGIYTPETPWPFQHTGSQHLALWYVAWISHVITRREESIAMDFEVTYTPEQEAFRAEVRAWLADNIPEGMQQPVDPGDLSLEQYQKSRELGRRLGAKGWLYPTYPKEYGGGDLSVDFVMILEEELDRYDMS